MEVRWLEAALADLEGIQDCLIQESPAAALRMVELLRAAALSLADMPHRGRPGRWSGTRELVVPGTPYLIPYRVEGDLIQILRVFHGAREWPHAP